MPPRKKKPRRRRDNSIRLLNVLEAYPYASIISEGTMGTSPWGFVTGQTDLQPRKLMPGTIDAIAGQTSYEGADEISLGDLAQEPGGALATMASNFTDNLTTMALQGIFTSVSFKVGRRLLRKPINNINRNIFKPLGMGVKL